MADPSGKPSPFVQYRVAIAATALLVALLLAVLVVVPVMVRAAVNRKAQQLGAVIEIDSVRMGWAGVWLRSVSLKVPDVPSLSLKLDSVRVVPSLTGRLRRSHAAGGTLELTGGAIQIAEQWQRWRGRFAKSEGSGGDAPQLELSGLHVRWIGLAAQNMNAFVWGLKAERDTIAQVVAFDLARVEGKGILVEATQLNAKWLSHQPKRLLDSLKVAKLSTSVDLPGVLALLEATSGSTAAPAAPIQPPDPPAEGSPPALVRLHQLRDRLLGWIKTGWSEQGSMQLPHVLTQLRASEQILNIGPARCNAERKGPVWHLSFVPGTGASQETLAFEVDLPLDNTPTTISLIGGPIGLDVLGVREGDFGLQHVKDIRFSARSVVTVPIDSMALNIAADGQVENLSFFQPKLASEVVDAERIGWSVRSSWKPEHRAFEISEGRLELGKLKAVLNGRAQFDGDNPAGKLNFEIPLVSCQALFESVPSSLLPMLRGTRLGGTFSVSALLDVQAAQLKDMQFDWTVKNDCRITEVPSTIAPERFRQRFQYQIVDAADLPLIRESGPMSRDWVALDQISPHMESAVIICEDSRFYAHRGIDEKAIEKALVANVQAGRFVRGASTISMQLAKNLYLGHEKTLSRKLQEAVLTVLLEQELTKQEILELYFNVIEFGPDIWGIRQAADYYFGVHPSDLTLAQSLYLASILPNPKYPHAQADGTLTPSWAEYLKKLMHIAHKIKRINDDELAKGLAENIPLLLGKEPIAAIAEPALGSEPEQPAIDIPVEPKQD